jgi:hypothetical protein
MDITPEIGFDNMKVLSRIKDPEERRDLEKAFIEGETADMIKARLLKRSRPENSLELLENEKRRIVRTIENLRKRLTVITSKIESLKN